MIASKTAAPVEKEKKEERKLSRRDFVAPVDVRWCPGCGDYAILNTIQNLFPSLGIPREKFVIASGIGCSSRFPYYMNTFGFHTIHGRAPAVATGIKAANPDLSVWVVTGDGDGLSIGGNHLMHLLRRNVGVKVLLFNNKIYGLTKGQYSPTSDFGFIRKSTPMGSVDQPINPLRFALASEATFVARTYDTNPKHMADVFRAAARHRGTAFVEILQNCVIFNDEAWAGVTAREVRDDKMLVLEQGQPLVFGKEKRRGIRLNQLKPEIVDIAEGQETPGVLVHDTKQDDQSYAYLLAGLGQPQFPVPIGVFRDVTKPTYEDLLVQQSRKAVEARGPRNLQGLLIGSDYWEVKATTVEVHQDARVKSDSLESEMQIIEERNREREAHQRDPMIRALATRINALEVTYGAGRVISVLPDDSVAKAITLLKEYNLECLLAVKNGKLEGIITSRDILMKVVLKQMDREKTAVKEIMTPRPDIAEAWNTVGDAINKMSIGAFRHLPVDHAGGAYGMVSVQDLLGYVYTQVRSKGTRKTPA